ncbi:hypothetical protein [Pleomorphomonas sp. NRK KF1]|uniref:hypothetical protein n=1 Tax=Pleomorphomonas sp. NRK KF1 TaxID=2943000 RepID=UPI0020449433|nr:hypothetical protein [Pleomorphomonas sp. NRK KF1]MCM5555881.1 hypothetical protein [Pleomorphomonas sp. NRK KF1]
MPLPSAPSRQLRRTGFARRVTMVLACGSLALSPGHAADNARRIAAELDIPRRAWTICTVNEIGQTVQRDRTFDAATAADGALTRCAPEEQALRTKAVQLLGAEAGQRAMERLIAEAREALIGSARTMQATIAAGTEVAPAWPRVVTPSR